MVITLFTPVAYFVISELEDKELAYWILFISFGSFGLVGTILNFWLSETPIDKSEFIFEEKNKEKEENGEKEEKEEIGN